MPDELVPAPAAATRPEPELRRDTSGDRVELRPAGLHQVEPAFQVPGRQHLALDLRGRVGDAPVVGRGDAGNTFDDVHLASLGEARRLAGAFGDARVARHVGQQPGDGIVVGGAPRSRPGQSIAPATTRRFAPISRMTRSSAGAAMSHTARRDPSGGQRPSADDPCGCDSASAIGPAPGRGSRHQRSVSRPHQGDARGFDRRRHIGRRVVALSARAMAVAAIDNDHDRIRTRRGPESLRSSNRASFVSEARPAPSMIERRKLSNSPAVTMPVFRCTVTVVERTSTSRSSTPFGTLKPANASGTSRRRARQALARGRRQATVIHGSLAAGRTVVRGPTRWVGSALGEDLAQLRGEGIRVAGLAVLTAEEAAVVARERHWRRAEAFRRRRLRRGTPSSPPTRRRRPARSGSRQPAAPRSRARSACTAMMFWNSSGSVRLPSSSAGIPNIAGSGAG